MAKKEETVAAEETKMDVRSVVELSLKKTGRVGVDDLIDFMDEIGFFVAPASGGNHSSGEGGLAEHSVNVLHMMEKFGVAAYGGEKFNEIKDSVVIASILHDLGKCGDYGKQMYVPNMVQDGRPTKTDPVQKYKLSDKKPFKRNTELLPIDHATRSIKLATLFIDLTEEEEFAIRYHDGLYETSNYGVKGHETPLYMLLHWADMWSSRVLEGDTGEGSEE
jgi:23S rRNA maturation-related 3'-5' exoribonuclease YhaM